MRSLFLALATSLLVATHAAAADPETEVRALYDRFVAAQNAHDLPAVRALLSDSPQFLWVSNGMTYWGADTMVERMGRFQQAEVWRVEPDLADAVVVEVDDGVAYLHLALTLVIGRADNPSNLRFLVSMLAEETPDGWKIAALFTTNENRG